MKLGQVLKEADQEKINRLLDSEKRLKAKIVDIREKISLAGAHHGSLDIKVSAEEELEEVKRLLSKIQDKIRDARGEK
jgi:divalent metal cation (Fe/Co/Zn/Cd) transporter